MLTVNTTPSKSEVWDSTTPIYSPQDLEELDPETIPQHVAIIMDGNRRWARNQGKHPIAGHWKGVDTLMHCVRSAQELGIKTLTVYAFSTENWKRDRAEVQALLDLFELSFVRHRQGMVENGVRLSTIGDTTPFSSSFHDALNRCKLATQEGEKIDLVLALNYGGRDELTRAMRSLAREVQEGALHPDAIHEEDVRKYLDTAAWPDPELLVRTSGEQRLSNFLLWQLSYAEIVVTEALWPDFSSHSLLDSVKIYQQRHRRLGK